MPAHPLAGLMKFVDRPEWRGPALEVFALHIGPACEKIGLDPDELDEVLGSAYADMIFGCTFEDLLTRTWDGENIVDDYLKRRGYKESATQKAYMKALKSSVMSLYEVSDIVVDQSFLARDLIRGGAPIRISERAGTHSLKPWDRIGARVVTVGSKHMITGGVLPFTFEAADALLAAMQQFDQAARNGTIGEIAAELGVELTEAQLANASLDALLGHFAPCFTTVWLDSVLGRLLGSGPQLQNSHGEPILFCTARFPIAPGAPREALEAALCALPDLRHEGDGFFNWVERAPPNPQPAASGGSGMMFITKLDDGSTVLGSIELMQDAVVLNTNSMARSERGCHLMRAALGLLVREPAIETHTHEELRASASAEPVSAPNSPLLPDQERALIDAYLDAHYHKVLNEPIRMLDGLNPREAARTAEGREKVVTWLKYLENQTAKNGAGRPKGSYDFRWLWQELGVAGHRASLGSSGDEDDGVLRTGS